MIPTFIRSHETTAEVEPFRIVAFSDVASSRMAATAAADTDPVIGVSDKMGAPLGGMVDVIRAGLGAVQLGAAVSAGDPLTSDASGKAIVCVAAAGETRRIIGFAEEPGVADDIIDAWIQPGLFHEPA
ncbi:capsid cement protein [Labrenzia sp. CE80]|uniref:capsid cement protein n=1 Tax=Labrenzia sp. CE80 TaxID=1788986 RepID=UPI00129A6DE7|nr:capsid cement protein [Labrenzia sp. CE80]